MDRNDRRIARPGRTGGLEVYTVPDFYCPFPSLISPDSEAVREEVLQWARRFGLAREEKERRRLRGADPGGLAARCHPEASLEGLRIVADFYAFMFLADDRRDESDVGEQPGLLASFDANYLDVLERRRPGGEPLAAALADLRQRLEGRANAIWMRRFVRSVRRHFEATAWEARNRRMGITPRLSDYIRMRPLTGGLAVDTELIEAIEGVRLPPEVREHPLVGSLTEASANAVCWANDLISFPKEIKCGDVHNLTVVLQAEGGLTTQEAIGRAARMYDDEVRKFARLEAKLPSFGSVVDAQLERYVNTLRARIRGNLEWSRGAGRYTVSVRITEKECS